jgi:hypothetical protein
VRLCDETEEESKYIFCQQNGPPAAADCVFSVIFPTLRTCVRVRTAWVADRIHIAERDSFLLLIIPEIVPLAMAILSLAQKVVALLRDEM